MLLWSQNLNQYVALPEISFFSAILTWMSVAGEVTLLHSGKGCFFLKDLEGKQPLTAFLTWPAIF